MKKLSECTDQNLMEQYVSGNNYAFDALLYRYKDRLFSYILCNVKDNDAANDIFQETFIRVITKIKNGKYIENGKFYGWISRIAHNLVIDFYRRKTAENLVSHDSSEANVLNRVTYCDREEDVCWEKDLCNHNLQYLVNELPESQRQIIFMRFFQNLSFKEIAEETGLSINTALGRMRYALINLRKLSQKAALTHPIY